MAVRLITADHTEAHRAVAEAEQKVNEFLARPDVAAQSIQTAIAEHTFDPNDARTFVVVVTIIYEPLYPAGLRR
jgi:hypothetical protein